MDNQRTPYTEDEAREAWLWVNRHGPSNSWTATAGTAARMIGRLLKERERLVGEVATLRARHEERAPYWLQPHD